MLVTSMASAKMMQNPVRVRLNSELLKDIFHKQDQDLINVFQNLNLGDLELSADLKIKDFSVNFQPKSGKHDEHDYHLSLDQNSFIGIETSELKFTGKGKIVHGDNAEGEEFTMEGPVSQFRFSCKVNDEVKGVGQKIDIQGIEFKIDQEQTTI